MTKQKDGPDRRAAVRKTCNSCRYLKSAKDDPNFLYCPNQARWKKSGYHWPKRNDRACGFYDPNKLMGQKENK